MTKEPKEAVRADVKKVDKKPKLRKERVFLNVSVKEIF